MENRNSKDDTAKNGQHSIKVVIDDRERSCELFSLLQTSPWFDIEIRRMTRGDYLIDNWLLIERKEVNDLVSSIVSGRLFKQAEKLARAPFTGLFVVEGNYGSIQSRISRSALLGTLSSINLIFSIGIIKVQSPQEALSVMRFAASQYKRQKAQDYARLGYRPKSNYRQQLFILQGLPNIGIKLAKQLLTEFTTVRDVINATPQQLTRIKGIGKHKAERIQQILTETYSHKK